MSFVRFILPEVVWNKHPRVTNLGIFQYEDLGVYPDVHDAMQELLEATPAPDDRDVQIMMEMLPGRLRFWFKTEALDLIEKARKAAEILRRNGHKVVEVEEENPGLCYWEDDVQAAIVEIVS